ncbi:MAG: dehydrogenase [Clostridia bacterium]|nr:dehydrogenase [Clostridia bacterium]
MMTTIGSIMSKNLLTVSPMASVGRASILMEQFKIGGLPVVEDGRLIGILTSRDVRRSHPNRLVADAMTKRVITVKPAASLWEARELLERHGIERLVVVEEGRPVGVVTKAQVLAELGKHEDALTGLNRAEFIQRKAVELLQQGKEITVIFFDLDDFGLIDKKLGHIFGDEVLRKVAQTMKSLMEEGVDYLCRYAGDEFAVVTTRPLEEAKKFARRVIEVLANEVWPEEVKVTASAGIAGGRRSNPRYSKREGAYSVSDLINMASLASTRAKKEGRSVVVAGQVELKEAVITMASATTFAGE